MKTHVLALTLFVSSYAHAALTATDVKACAYSPTTGYHFFRSENPKLRENIYLFKGNDLYRVKAPVSSPTSFSIPAIAKGTCFSNVGASTETDCKASARETIKLDGVAFNEALNAVMDDYIQQANSYTDSGSDPMGRNESMLYVKDLAKKFKRCAELGPLTADARAALNNAKAAIRAMNNVYGIKDDESVTTDAVPGAHRGAK